MPDITLEVQPALNQSEIRTDIASLIGLDPAKAAEIKKQRAQEEEVVRVSRQNGEKTYDQLKDGQEVDSVNLGIGKFDLSPTDKVNELVPNVEKRVKEITPPPPQEHINIFLDSFAQKALDDKNFEAAVASYNYITNERLNDPQNNQYIQKLSQAAQTPDEKYDLYLALNQVIPESAITAQPPETVSPYSAQPEPKLEEPSHKPIETAEDYLAWQRAAGIAPKAEPPEVLSVETPKTLKTEISPVPEPITTEINPVPEPQPLPQNPPTLPQQPEINPAPPQEPTPNSNYQTPKPESSPYVSQPTTIENPAPLPHPEPMPVTQNIHPVNSQPSPEPQLRPVPAREDAEAQGLIQKMAADVPSQPISASEPELAKAA